MMDNIREAAVNFEAVKISMSQDKNGIILRLSLHPNECPPSLHTDWVGSRYMVAMVKLNDQDEPEISDQERETEKLIRVAGMLCRNVDFAHYMFEKGIIEDYDYTDDEKREKQVVDGLRQHLGINSRTDLRNNSIARETFKEMTEQFREMKKGKAV